MSNAEVVVLRGKTLQAAYAALSLASARTCVVLAEFNDSIRGLELDFLFEDEAVKLPDIDYSEIEERLTAALGEEIRLSDYPVFALTCPPQLEDFDSFKPSMKRHRGKGQKPKKDWQRNK